MSNSREEKWEKILKNSIQFKYCGEIIKSKTVYDFVTCFCGRCSVDGGKEYLCQLAEEDSYIELLILEISRR
ncbi:hypothetical protein RBU61_05620 [Tissierella sp. MB52-C2]|uniref:DUF7695 domain-containing protein n=1 Tax=Tissierella sp. MB52-C2 TaxID=3070999 RepID=UPI00280C1004|nr:hypothetical protein [Tissierella sp. MB52-C2]WMM26154.1 hypothetical protein RBU61_05620 [Tissierella sp. MB52-C2]